jgi:hypothetical protein
VATIGQTTNLVSTNERSRPWRPVLRPCLAFCRFLLSFRTFMVAGGMVAVVLADRGGGGATEDTATEAVTPAHAARDARRRAREARGARLFAGASRSTLDPKTETHRTTALNPALPVSMASSPHGGRRTSSHAYSAAPGRRQGQGRARQSHRKLAQALSFRGRPPTARVRAASQQKKKAGFSVSGRVT